MEGISFAKASMWLHEARLLSVKNQFAGRFVTDDSTTCYAWLGFSNEVRQLRISTPGKDQSILMARGECVQPGTISLPCPETGKVCQIPDEVVRQGVGAGRKGMRCL